MATDKNTIRGRILEALPNLEFRVDIGSEVVRCYTSGKMRHNEIKILIGDTVDIVWPQGSAIGRIVYRE